MKRHEPESKSFRVAVIRKTDSVQVGSMPAHPGMALADGRKVAKVNEKSILVSQEGCSDFRITHLVSVHLNEAKKFGF
jgi:hypothetical protein